jgi:tetratricopeptide (TPR) repeat protein
LLFFALALFSKELGFIMAGMIVLYVLIIIKGRIEKAYIAGVAFGWGLVIVAWVLARQMAFNNPMKLGISDSFTSIWRDIPAIFIFLGKILFPVKLSVLPILQDSTYIFGFITITILVVAFAFTQKPRFNFIFFGAVWFIMFLIPSFLTSKISVVSFFVEHRIYLPMIGFIIVALETDIVKKLESQRELLLKIGAALIVGFSVLTVMHSTNFRSRSDFWKSAVETSPHSPLARRNLGAMYYIDGTQMLDIADQEYRIDLQNNPKAQRNFNSKYYVEGMRLIGMAEMEFRKSLELNAPEIMAHNNIGLIYMRKNMYKEAEEEFKKELEVNPFYDKGLFNLGLCYKEMRNIKKMEAVFLEKQGKTDESKEKLRETEELLANAEKYWNKSFQINPDNVEAYKTLVMFYIEEKNGAKTAHFVNELQRRGVDIPPEVFRMLQQLK